VDVLVALFEVCCVVVGALLASAALAGRTEPGLRPPALARVVEALVSANESWVELVNVTAEPGEEGAVLAVSGVTTTVVGTTFDSVMAKIVPSSGRPGVVEASSVTSKWPP
jgi:hypothetical protein